MKLIRISLIILILVLLIFSVFYSRNINLDASSDTLILQNDTTFQYYEYYNSIFPSQNFLVLAVKSDQKINIDYVKNLKDIQNKLNQIENIESTFSILDAPILLLNNLSLKDLNSKEIEYLENSSHDISEILDEFSSSPVFKDQIINSNKNLSSIIIYVNNDRNYEELKNKRKLEKDNSEKIKKLNIEYKFAKEKNNLKKEKLILNIRKILDNQNNEYQYYLGGIDMISIDTINFVKKDIIVFSTAVLLLTILILFLIYRDFKWVIVPLLSSIFSVLIMIGFIGMMNIEITAISSNFISLMIILSISMNIHIINNYRLNYFDTKIINKLKYTITNMFWPCFYTALTTIVAFASLLLSNIRPIMDFGNIMIISLIFIFLTSFTILPLLIFYFPQIKDSSNIKFSILNKFSRLAINQSNKILIINLIIFLVSILGIYKLNVENSFINYFKSNTEIHKGMKLIDTELGGTTPLDILITFKKENNDIDIQTINDDILDEDIDIELNDIFLDDENENNSWFTADKLLTIKKIHNYLDEKNEIGKVQSLFNLIEIANMINKEELNIFELSILYNEMPLNYKENLISPYLSIDDNMIKISARVRDSYLIKRDNLITDIHNYIENNFDNIEEFKVNGLLVLYNNMLQSLFKSQIKSFGAILFVIFMMFIILFRSIKLSLIGIIPNIIASSFILGLIGLLGIPLDIMTITIAAITIGIAVDNTIHYIYRIKENRNKHVDIKELIENTNKNVGYAVLTTSITIAFGFSILALSNFIPTILFGTFTALAMIIAMIGVLITLPSILNKFKL